MVETQTKQTHNDMKREREYQADWMLSDMSKSMMEVLAHLTNVLDNNMMLNNKKNFAFSYEDKKKKEEFLDIAHKLLNNIEIQ